MARPARCASCHGAPIWLGGERSVVYSCNSGRAGRDLYMVHCRPLSIGTSPSESTQSTRSWIARRASKRANRPSPTEAIYRASHVRKALSTYRLRHPSASPSHQAACRTEVRPFTSLHRRPFLADHKFKVGQTVDFSPGRSGMPAVSRLYKIVKLLPPEDGQFLYRIKGSSEPFERVARERDLSWP